MHSIGASPPTRQRSQRPTLMVPIHEKGGFDELVWALRVARQCEATVLAVALVDSAASQGRRDRALAGLEAQVLRAVGETGVHGRSRTALMDPLVYEAIAATAQGGDLVVARPQGTAVLRRPSSRRAAVRPVWVA